MVGMSLPGWMWAGLALFSLLTTLIATGLVFGWRLEKGAGRSPLWLAMVLMANALWAVMVFAGGVLAARYAERMAWPWAGFLIYAVGAMGLSFVQARLLQQVDEGDVNQFWLGLVHRLLYPLAAIVLFLPGAALLRQRAQPWLLLPLFSGMLLPGLIERIPRIKGHSLAGLGMATLATTVLIPILGIDGWVMIALGYLAHLLVDLMRPAGIAAGWPIHQKVVRLWGGLARHSKAERWALVVLGALAALLLTQVEVGPEPPPASPVLSFEQSIDRYYALRGRTLVFAQVWGSWQTSGRPASGRFEVLNGEGASLILLDRYDGRVFSAGREATDDFYVDSLSLSTGTAVQIKAVDVHLDDQYLAEALPILYAMQKEAGLEHIFVSGELLVDEGESEAAPTPSLSQDRLRAVETIAPGHYRLNYLTAVELREMAAIFAQAADLVVVGTYRTPAEGPTATPLPPLPAMPGAGS